MLRPYLTRLFVLSIIAPAFFACTPKVAPVTTTDTSVSTMVSKPAKKGEELSPCDKFSDTRNPDQAETDYVVYRNLFKAKDMALSMRTWRKVYANSPAADGRRKTVFTDGITFYNDLIQQYPERKEAYADTLIQLYNKARECYPGDGYMSGIQAFTSYYTYPGTATDEEMYALFKESIDIDGREDLNYFIINPMSGLTVKLFKEEKITEAEAKEVVDALRFRLAKGLSECGTPEACAPWKKIQDYAPGALRYFETVKGFYDCQYFVDQYYAEYQANPDDCDEIRTAFSRMKFGGCAEDNPKMQELTNAFNSKCKIEVEPSAGTWSSKVRAAYKIYQDGNPSGAVRLFEEAMPDIPAEKQFTYQLLVAKIYYRDLRSFSSARSWARRAAQSNPQSGEPYLLIGTLYASSGPLCGPGTGFDSQVVTWPAIDKWQQAKRIDAAVAGKANKLINTYTQYMPTKSDVFQRSLKEGDTFTVGCWINESTTIRTP